MQSKNNVLIKNFFKERDFEISEKIDLFELGAIDSMVIIELVIFLEDNLGTGFDSTNMNADNFRTLDNILAFIESSNS